MYSVPSSYVIIVAYEAIFRQWLRSGAGGNIIMIDEHTYSALEFQDEIGGRGYSQRERKEREKERDRKVVNHFPWDEDNLLLERTSFCGLTFFLTIYFIFYFISFFELYR